PAVTVWRPRQGTLLALRKRVGTERPFEGEVRMHVRHWIVCVAVTVLFISPVLRAEQHIVEGPKMTAVLAAQDAHDQANREAVLRVLDRDDVREMAARL